MINHLNAKHLEQAFEFCYSYCEFIFITKKFIEVKLKRLNK
jgi:hypothetical protein